MFRLSKITDYGIVLLTQLASRDDQTPHNARELAEEVDLPLPVVSKILKSLARRDLLRSHRGAKGGYCLSRPATQISVTDMVEALEGPVALTECGVAPGACPHEQNCRVRDPWQMINRVVQVALNQITLADLARPDFSAEMRLARLLELGSGLGQGADRNIPTQ